VAEHGEITLTEKQLERHDAFYEWFPGWRRRWELFAHYARAKRGLTLEACRMIYGPAFGERQIMTFERCAERLGVPQSEVHKVVDPADHWTEVQLRRDPEWLKLQGQDKRKLFEEALVHLRQA
jgi:hypothetical protein